MATNITYKGSELASFSNNTKILKTAGKYLEDDITVSASTVLGTTTVVPSETTQTISPASGQEGLSSVTVNGITNTYVGSGIDRLTSADITITYNGTQNNIIASAKQGYFSALTPSRAVTPAGVLPTQAAATIVPSETAQIAVDQYKWATGTVTVAAITSTYVGSSIPRPGSSGISNSITNGYYKISVSPGYYPGTANKSLGLQNPTVIPSETEQVKRPTSNNYYLESVTVAAITPTYVGSGITTRSSLTVAGPTVTASAGYYASDVTATIAAGAITSTIYYGTITPRLYFREDSGLVQIQSGSGGDDNVTIVETPGYISTDNTVNLRYTIGSTTYQLPTLPAQTFTPSSSTQTVASTGKYMLGDITVQPIPSEYIVPTGTLTITHAGTTSVTNYANVDVPVADVVATSLQDSFTTVNNVRKWEARWAAYCERDGWADGGEINSNSHLFDVVQTTTITPSSATQTVGGKYYMMEGTVTVAPVTTGYLKGMLTMPTDIDFSTGHTPTATWTVEPSGMVIYQCYGSGSITNAVYSSGYIENTQQIPAEYEAGGSYQLPTQGATTVIPSETAQTLSVNQKYMTGNVTVAAITSTYVGSGITRNPTITVSGPSVTIPAGYYSSQQTKTVASGSINTTTEPTVTCDPNITVSSSGLITSGNSGGEIITINVNPGYIASNATLAVNVAGTSTYQLSTLGAQTITPSSATQTVSSNGKYMTGNVTVNPIPSQYIVPSGTYTISSVDSTNTFNVTNYASAKITITDADSIAY